MFLISCKAAMSLLLLYKTTIIASFKCFLSGIWLLKVFDIVENMSGENAHLRWHLALWGSVSLTGDLQFTLYQADAGRQEACCRVVQQSVDVSVLNKEGTHYRHRCILLTAMHRDGSPFLSHLSNTFTMCCKNESQRFMFQGCCAPFLEAGNFLVLAWPRYSPKSPPLSMFGMLWINVNGSMFQSFANSQEQPTTDNLIISAWRNCVELHETDAYHARYLLVDQILAGFPFHVPMTSTHCTPENVLHLWTPDTRRPISGATWMHFKIKLRILVRSFIMVILKPTCATIMLIRIWINPTCQVDQLFWQGKCSLTVIQTKSCFGCERNLRGK